MTIRIVYSFEIPGRGARALGHHLWIIRSLFRNRNLALNHYSKNWNEIYRELSLLSL